MIAGASQGSREFGFAFAEFAVIIALVCVLAAFALPRFVTLEVETRAAATTSVGSLLRSRAARAHQLWLEQGQPAGVVLDGQEVALVHGYPTAGAAASLLGDSEGFIVDLDAAALVVSRSRDGVTPLAACSVRYAEAAGSMSAPRIQVQVGGC